MTGPRRRTAALGRHRAAAGNSAARASRLAVVPQMPLARTSGVGSVRCRNRLSPESDIVWLAF